MFEQKTSVFQELFEIRARRDELKRIREERKKAVMISLNLNADDQNTVVVEQVGVFFF